MPSTRRLALARTACAAVLVTLIPLVGLLPASAAEERRGYERTVRLTFPFKGGATYSDTYHAPRDGGKRIHQATDIMVPKGKRIYAAKTGTVCWITGIDSKMPSYGYMVTICGTDGLRYNYLHLNNDDPGTDNGRGGVEHAYAKRTKPGALIRRGEFIGWAGDSGYAEETPPHLHFEISDPLLTDRRIADEPYDPHRLNPFYSLRRAQAREDYPGAQFPDVR